MGLVGLTEVKTYKGITDTSQDALITDLITDFSDVAEKYCQRSFASNTYQEKYDVRFEWQNEISLKQYPATTINWIKVGGVTLDTEDWYYDLDAAIIKLAYDNRYLKARDQVEVLYVAGYTVMPSALKLAVKKLIAIELQDRKFPGLESAKLLDFSYKKAKLTEEGIPRDVALLLDQFVNVSL